MQRGKQGREKIQTQFPSPPLISGTSPPLTLGICRTWAQMATQTAPGDLQGNQVNVTVPMIQVQSRHKEKRDVAHNLEDNWRQKLAEKNDWYKWMAYTGRQHGWTDCYTCSRVNPDKIYIVNTRFNWTTCNRKGNVPWCPAECLLFLGSSMYGAYLTFYDMNANKLKNLPVNFTYRYQVPHAGYKNEIQRTPAYLHNCNHRQNGVL